MLDSVRQCWIVLNNVGYIFTSFSLIAILLFLAFKLMTSTEVENDDKMKCALGVWTADQMEVLERCLHFISNMSFKSKTQKSFGIKPFQNGMMGTIRGVIKVQIVMKNDYQEDVLCTVTCIQDYVERKFGVYRFMNGSCTNPPALTALRTVAQDLKCQLLNVNESIEFCF